MLDKTPPEILKEFILVRRTFLAELNDHAYIPYRWILISHALLQVDDASDSPHCQQPLQDFVDAHPKVKLVRLKERSGLIKGRTAGARAATGDTVTFLDSQVEATVGWAEPLLARIAQDRRNVVFPVIDYVYFDNLE